MINMSIDSVVGIDLDELRANVSISHISTERIESQTYNQIPPSILMPQLENEPIRLDFNWPPNCRGLGQTWPPSARINHDENAGRVPLAYVWNALMKNHEWSWHEQRMKPERAMAAAVSALANNTVQVQGRSLVVCTIPNLLNEFSQQRFIDACGLFGIKIKLLWRPVAAAMCWCNLFSDFLVSEALRSDCFFKQLEDVLCAKNASLGQIACIHFGLDQVESTLLDVAALQISKGFQFLPIRKRPVQDSVVNSFGMDLIFFIAHKYVELNDGVITPERVWNLIWGTPFVTNLFSMVRGSYFHNSVPYEILGYHSDFSKLRSFFEEYVSTKNKDFSLSGFKCFEGFSFNVQDWSNWRTKQYNQSGKILGIVVTGSLAEIKNHPFSKWISGIAPNAPILYCADEKSQILSQMVACYGSMLLQGRPTYLDTLPRLKIATLKRGEPCWVSLLTEDDQYVEGGKVWKRPDNIEGFEILSGSKDLTVAFHHENFETVRKIKSNFPSPTSDRTQVSLSVSMEPAHGNASIEVIPLNSCLLAQQKLFLEWKYMENTSKTPKQYLDEDVLRICPELRHRSSNRPCWTRAWGHIFAFLRAKASKQSSVRMNRILEECKDSLRSAPIGNTANRDDRAISSEGIPPSQHKDLDDFIKSVLSILKDDQSKIAIDLCVRTLGYTMTPNQEFTKYLMKQLKLRSIEIDTAELVACGLCLRKPSDIQLFTKVLYMRICNKKTGVANWIKAFAYILRFRQQATAELDSEECKSIARCLLDICQQQYDERKLNFLFRYASQAIIYLLRRRIYDDGFLDPNSSLARDIKALFNRVIRAIKTTQIEFIGGAVDLRIELQKFIDYIDRRGAGMLALIDSDD